MYIKQSHANQLVLEFKHSVSEEIKDKMDFFYSLEDTDDWSMIIKIHSLIETVVTELIIAQVREDNLKPVIERLPLFDEQIGKIRITKDYDLLTSNQRKFIKRFSELRNNVVHKFENINFDLKEYVSLLDTNQKKSWSKTLTWYADEQETRRAWEEAAIKEPRVALWFSSIMFINLSIIRMKELENSKKLDKLSMEFLLSFVDKKLTP